MLFAANWKMHGNPQYLASFSEGLLSSLESCPHQVVLCPPFPLLPQAVMLLSGSPVAVGAQNCHWEKEGAFTGEVSPYLLAEMEVSWVIVGHSERRALFGEKDQTAGIRARGAQSAGLSVIYCVGETLIEREAGQTFSSLRRQLEPLAHLSADKLVVAYEPVWAIGTGKHATSSQIAEAHDFIETSLESHFHRPVPVLYGGSVKPESAQEILHTAGVAGALVGGASLDVGSFLAIIKAAP